MHRNGGFTLIEMIVVIVVLALIAGLVISRGPLRSNRVDMEATVRALTGALRLARGQAIADNRVVTVKVTPSGFAVDGGSPWLLPRGESLTPATVIFTPEGQSSGGVIGVEAGGSRVAVRVDWLTGRVRTASENAE